MTSYEKLKFKRKIRSKHYQQIDLNNKKDGNMKRGEFQKNSSFRNSSSYHDQETRFRLNNICKNNNFTTTTATSKILGEAISNTNNTTSPFKIEKIFGATASDKFKFS